MLCYQILRNNQQRRSHVKEGALSSSLNRQPVLHPPLEHLYEIVTNSDVLVFLSFALKPEHLFNISIPDLSFWIFLKLNNIQVLVALTK